MAERKKRKKKKNILEHPREELLKLPRVEILIKEFLKGLDQCTIRQKVDRWKNIRAVAGMVYMRSYCTGNHCSLKQ